MRTFPRVHRAEQEALQQKMQQIEKKIIVGGENLLEKAEEQERLLEESAKELEERRRKADELRKALEEKEVRAALHCLLYFIALLNFRINFIFIQHRIAIMFKL